MVIRIDDEIHYRTKLTSLRCEDTNKKGAVVKSNLVNLDGTSWYVCANYSWNHNTCDNENKQRELALKAN